MNGKPLTKLIFPLLIYCFSSFNVNAIELIGDNTNAYTASISNVTLQQSSFLLGNDRLNGIIRFINGSYTVEEGGSRYTQIGGTEGVPFRPSQFVINKIFFRIEDSISGEQYDAQMTFWNAPQGGNAGGQGIEPVPFNKAGFVIQLTPLTSVPIPAMPIFFLFLAGILIYFFVARIGVVSSIILFRLS